MDERIERMKATDRRFHAALSEGRLEVVDEVCTPDMVIHDPSVPGGEVIGRDAAKLYFAGLRVAFPDFRIGELLTIGEGDHIAGRARITGTHQGEFMGIPATGRRLDFDYPFFIRFEGDREAEFWLTGNAFAMFAQLGVAPRMPTPATPEPALSTLP